MRFKLLGKRQKGHIKYYDYSGAGRHAGLGKRLVQLVLLGFGLYLIYELSVWVASGAAYEFVRMRYLEPDGSSIATVPSTSSELELLADGDSEAASSRDVDAPKRSPSPAPSPLTVTPAGPVDVKSEVAANPARGTDATDRGGPAARVPQGSASRQPRSRTYRIQVMAVPDSVVASREAERLERILKGEFPVHLEFLPPYYKIRVGNFPTEADARMLHTKLRGLGYPDAWLVAHTDSGVR